MNFPECQNLKRQREVLRVKRDLDRAVSNDYTLIAVPKHMSDRFFAHARKAFKLKNKSGFPTLAED